MKPIIESARLRLRKLTLDDLDVVAEMLANPEVMAFWPQPLTRDESRRWIARQMGRYEAHGHGYWLALDRETDSVVGQAGIMMNKFFDTEEPSLGYILHRAHWGRGLATEAASACLDYALKIRGYPRVLCAVRPENIPSIRVAIRLDLRPIACVDFASFQHLIFASQFSR